MKKLSVILFIIILAASFAVMSSAEGETAVDSDWKYEIQEDGTAKITKYIGESTEVIIPSVIGETVVSALGNELFRGAINVEKVVVPDSVKTIGMTFYMAEGLKEIEFGRGLEIIGNNAFYCAWALEKISVSEENENYAAVDGVLYSKDMTRLILLPAGIKAESFTVPDGVEVLVKSSMRDASIKKLLLPDTLKTIESYAISLKGLANLTIPGSVEAIDLWAIYNCENLVSVEIKEGQLNEIGSMVFDNCPKLETITVPANVTAIGTFNSCGAIKEYIVAEENESFYTENGVLFTKDKTKIVSYPCGKADKSYNIPDSVTVIGENSFYGAKKLKSVHFGKNIKNIEPFAFAYCSSLSVVYFDGSEAEFGEIDIDEETVFFSNVVYADSHVHSYDGVKIVKKATNKSNGKVQYICSCGESRSETVYKLSSVKLSTSKCIYNGKKRTPSVIAKDSKGNKLVKGTDYTVKYESGRKMPGRYKITVTFKGKYEYKKEFDFVITPKTPTLKVTASKTKVTLTCSKLTGVTGYQIYYSTDGKSYKKLTTVKNTKYVKNLKGGKKYYFKVRGYVKPNNGSTVYGSFSSVKKVTVK